LANALASELTAPLVPEVSRDYLEQKMAENSEYRYDKDDLLTIARKQVQSELTTSFKHPDMVVCDTDLLVIIIWSEVRFGDCHPWILETFEKQVERGNRAYLLCDYDMPWEPDPLRESAETRPELFRLYQEKLDTYNLDYHIIKGSAEERLKSSCALTPRLY
jgi:nicotinamide riboside kinase